MKIKQSLLILLISLVIFSLSCSVMNQNDFVDPMDYVNPFIGTINSGNTNPGAATPWGMVTVSPHNIERGQFLSRGNPTPYQDGNPHLYGFSNIAISGVGCHASGSIVFMPTTGELKLKTDDIKSAYSHETASPGYYSAVLDDWGVTAEMTATTRTGLHRYTFPAGKSHVILNLGFSVGHVRNGWSRIVSETEIEGYKPESWFCGYNDYREVYFAARFSKASESCGTFVQGKKTAGSEEIASGEMSGLYFTFDTEEGESIVLKVGISFVSVENAWENLDAEQPGFAFDETLQKAQAAWKNELSKIRVAGGTEEDREKFYSALYHCLLNPHIFEDVNGEYVRMGDNETGQIQSGHRYSVFSLWDTYRTLHPLLALVYPEKQVGMVHSMLGMYEEGGWLPLWELRGDETYCMVGDPATSVVADTYLKGLIDDKAELALEAMVKQASVHEERNPMRRCVEEYEALGYIPHEYEQNHYIPPQKKPEKSAWGTVSTTLEFAYADWALAQAAEKMGRQDIYEKFNTRSQNYRNLYETETGFFRSRLASGAWREPFEPTAGYKIPGHMPTKGIGYCEGSAWNYAFFVPHDVPGVIELTGGPAEFTEKLQTCFDKGYFDMGNEPDIGFPYQFNYVEGEAWRTQKTVDDLVRSHFGTGPDGLPGNDDLGTLSAWLVFSMMGIYPDCPGSNQYQITSPAFDAVQIALDDNYYAGSSFLIQTNSPQAGGRTIQTMMLNDELHREYNLSFEEVVKGGKLEIELGEME